MSALVIVLIVLIALAAICAVIAFGWSMLVRATTRIVLDELHVYRTDNPRRR